MSVREQPREARLTVWERRTDWPLVVLAVAFLAVYATDVLARSLSEPAHQALRLVDYVIWALFALD